MTTGLTTKISDIEQHIREIEEKAKGISPPPTPPEAPVSKEWGLTPYGETLLPLVEQLYPELIDTGIPEEDLPVALVGAFQDWIIEDPDSFIEDLRTKGRTLQTEALLKAVVPDITLEDINLFFEGLPQPMESRFANLEMLVGKLFPERETTATINWAIENPEAFAQAIRDIGHSRDTEALVQLAYNMTEEEALGFFGMYRTPEGYITYTEEGLRAKFPGPRPPIKPSPEPLTEKERKVIYDQRRQEIYAKYPKAPYTREEMQSDWYRKMREEQTEAFNEWQYGGEPSDPWAVLQVFGEGLTKLPQQVGAAILQAFQGQGGASVVDKDWADRFIEQANIDLEQFIVDTNEEYGDRITFELAQFPRNLAFSVTSMGAGLAVGVPTAFVPVPGARVAAYMLGSATSGWVAYQMTTYQIMQQYLELKNEEKIAETGRGLTLEEERQLKADFESEAHRYGLWEAIPEAVSNLAFVSILTTPLTGMLGRNLATKIISKITAMYGQELLTETITQKGQSAIEVEAGLREGRITWAEAFKEIAPQTFLLTTIMGGAGQTIVSSSNAIKKIKDSLKTEIGETHPLYEGFVGEATAQYKATLEGKVPPTAEARMAVRAELEPEVTKLTEQLEKISGIEKTYWNPQTSSLTVYYDEAISKDAANVRTQKYLAESGMRDSIETITFISTPKGTFAIPVAEPGMPEAGYQPAMFEEVIDREVRPRGKGELVQISMEDQLKLEQAGRAAEEARPDVREAYEAQAEIEGLKVTHELDPVAQARFTIGGKKVDLTHFISLRERGYPDYFTLKEARALFPGHDFSFYAQKGTPQYNKVPRADALDDLTKRFNMTPDEIADRVMAIRNEKARIKALEADIARVETEKPLETLPEIKPEEVTISPTGEQMLTPAQVEKALTLFGLYVESPNAVNAWELTRELRRETRAGQAENLKARTQELIVEKGLDAETAMKQAIQETLSGELPVATTDYLSDLTTNMRAVLFNKVYESLKAQPFEMASTLTALTNALQGRAIPREPGVKGGSAYTRLQRVFAPEVFKAINKAAKEGKSLQDVIESLYEVVGQPPIPVDPKIAEWLRNLQESPYGVPTLFEKPSDLQVSDLRTPAELEYAKRKLDLDTAFVKGEIDETRYKIDLTEAYDRAYPGIPVTKFEAPIEDAFKQFPMFTFMEKKTIVRVLKELAYSPLDIGNFLRANKASLDQSFLRQARLLASGHPIMFAKAYREAWQATFSQRATEAAWERITRDPDFQIYEQIRLDTGHDPLRVPAFAGVKGTAQYRTAEEFGFPTQERWLPTLTGKIPWIKLSERGFSTGLNSITWGVWKAKLQFAREYLEKIASGQVKLKEGEAFSIIQEMTGQQAMLADMGQRATLRRASGLAPAFNAFFFALRSKMGRFLMPRHLISSNPRVRKEAWKDFVLMNAMVGGIMLLGDWLDLWETEKDPRNAEFMSARIGNTRIDPWAGYRQFVVLYARLATGTGISSVTGAEYEVNKIAALTTFVRSSLSPMAGILLDFWTGRNFLGQVVEITDARQWLERTLPFSIVDVWEAYEEDSKMGLIVIPLAIHGEGVQTYTGDWVENFTKLGLPKYLENTGYGIMEPYYDTADFWADTASQFKGVDPAALTKAKGFPEYIRAIVEARLIKEHLGTLPGKKFVSLNADPAEGITFADYYRMWADREKLVVAGDKAVWTRRELQPDGKYKTVTYKGEDALKAFDQDERTRNANLGNFSQRQFALLNEYWTITDKAKQAEFLEKHPELGVNPRQDWLRVHPKENAQLAVWGQAKILTMEAYKEVQRLIKELDIPDNAIPEFTLPPEGSVENYFKYMEQGEEFGYNSAEVKLIIAQDDDLRIFLDREPIDTPIKALELKVKWRETEEQYEAIEGTEDRQAFLEANPEYADDRRRIDAYSILPEDLIEDYVEWYKTPRKGYEDDWFLMEHKEFYDTMVELEQLKERDFSKVPDIKYKEFWTTWADVDERYDVAEDKQAFLDANPEYADVRRRRDAVTYGLPEDLIETYVQWYKVDKAGYADDWFLMENKEFYNTMVSMGQLTERDFSGVPTRAVAGLYDKYLDVPSGKTRLIYRHENPALEQWLVSEKGYTPVGDRWKDGVVDGKEKEEITTDPALANRKYWLDRAGHYKDLLKNLGIREDITPEALTDYQAEQIQKAIEALYE